MGDPDTIEYTPFLEHRVRSGDTLESIAEKHGLTWQDLTMFNFGTDVPSEVNLCLHEFTGCTRRTKDRRNYMFSDADVPGIIYVPKRPEKFTLATGERHRIRVKRPILYSRVEVETVDEFGHRVGNVDLILRSEDGLPDEAIKSDGAGYGKLDKVRAGRYRVLLASGKPAFMFDPTKVSEDGTPDEEGDQLVEAHLETRNHSRAITRVVVSKGASEEWRKQHKLLKQIHERTGATTSLEGQGEATSGESRQSRQCCADNLAIAAGWNQDRQLDQKALVSKVLRGFLRDYHPTALARGYHVLMLFPGTRTLEVMSSAGEVEKRFQLADGMETTALIGAYGVFENVGGTLFVDLTAMSTIVAVPQMPDGIDVEQIVSDPQGLHEALQKHAGEVEILYYAPTGAQLALFALLGGTGRLEDYGTDEAVNRSIHERNLAVCHGIKIAYDAYTNHYIHTIEKMTSEDELRKLGPPRTPYEMPIPAGATDQQMAEIYRALDTRELEVWHAIAVQLDRFANRLSQGYPFFRIKPKFVAKPKSINKIKKFLRLGIPDVSEKIPVEIEFEMNIDIQLVEGQFEVVTKGDALIKGKLKLDSVVKAVTKKNVPVEIAYKQSLGNPEKQVVTVRISKFQIESDTVGKTKISLEVTPGVWMDSEMNTRSGMFGGGVTLKGKDLAAAMKGKNAFFDKWAGYLEDFELQVQVGFVGTREETILAVLSHAPGFFERRSLKELFDAKTHWVDLSLDEQHALVALGWYAAVWDAKYHEAYKDKLPESVHMTRHQLSDVEKVSIIHLGFYAYEDYGKLFKTSAQKFCDYVY
jgi:hypothetical protein